MKSRILTAAALVGALLGSARQASALPYEPGERLKMGISYMHMTIGDVDLTVGETVQSGVRVWPLQLRARTFGFFNSIHSVDDRYTSTIDPVTLSLVSTESDQKQKQGRSNETVHFDGATAYIHRVTRDGSRDKTATFQPGSHDILSAIYYLRSQDYSQGEVTIPIFNGNQTWQLVARQTGTERVSTDAGKFDTIVVKCRTQFGGDFSKGREMTVWLSNDERRIPVKIEAGYMMGTMRAELKSFSSGPLAQR